MTPKLELRKFTYLTREEASPPSQPLPQAARDAVDVADILAIVRRKWLTVLGIAAFVFIGVMGVTLMSKMSFRATSRLYLGELSNPTRNAGSSGDELETLGNTGGDVGSEMEIIRSRSLVTRAVLDSGLNVNISRMGSSGHPRYWKWLLARRNPNLLAGTEHELFATDTNSSQTILEPQTYRLAIREADAYELWSGQRLLGKGSFGQVMKAGPLSVRLEKGTAGPPRVGSEYWMVLSPLNEVVDAVMDALEVAAAKTPVGAEPVKVIQLGFSAESPNAAVKFLDRLMAGYLDERQSWKTEDATLAGEFVTGQLSNMRDTLSQIEKKLAEYRSTNRVVVLDSEAKAMIEQVGKYEEQRVAARLEVAALADVKRALKDPTVPVEAFMVGEAKDSVLEGMAAALAKSRRELAESEARFNAPAPNLREQQVQVEAQQAAIKSYVTGRLQRAQDNLGTLTSIIRQFEDRLKTVPGAELGLTQLSRESEVYSSIYSYLLKRQQQAAIIKASTVSKNRVLDVPQLPYKEDAPKLLMRIASAPLGLLLGAIAVVLGALLSGKLQSENDVSRLALAPVIARLPTRRGLRRRTSEEVSSFEFSREPRDAEWIEACRALRMNVYRLTEAVERPVILVTSPVSRDGKTVCVLSLAEMLAADGKATVVIDADLRRRTRQADDDTGPDLNDVLVRACPWQDAVRSVPAPRGEFHVLGGREGGDAELIASGAMPQLIHDLRTCYEFILLDVSSFPLTSDALGLAQYASCVLSIIRLRSTPRRMALQHFGELKTEAPHAIVINDSDSRGALHYFPSNRRQRDVRFDRDPISQVTIPGGFLAGSERG
jgi:tyrosine-protein kinase Etk/Wzc